MARSRTSASNCWNGASAPRASCSTSCTSALEMAALLCDVAPGDEVILPSYTFVSTANAFLLRGATRKFVDIHPDTLNMDERLVEQAITPRTKVIVPVHYASIGCEMAAIGALARKRSLFVVEDAAQAVDATYRGAYLGTLGTLGAYSFHASKNFRLRRRRRAARQRCQPRGASRDRSRRARTAALLRGQVDKYTWVDVGSSYVPADVLAALLLSLAATHGRDQLLDDSASTSYLRRPTAGRARAPDSADDPGTLQFELSHVPGDRRGPRDSQRLIEHLKAAGILAVFHYVPLHTSPVRCLAELCGRHAASDRVGERSVAAVCRCTRDWQMQRSPRSALPCAHSMVPTDERFCSSYRARESPGDPRAVNSGTATTSRCAFTSSTRRGDPHEDRLGYVVAGFHDEIVVARAAARLP